MQHAAAESDRDEIANSNVGRAPGIAARVARRLRGRAVTIVRGGSKNDAIEMSIQHDPGTDGCDPGQSEGHGSIKREMTVGMSPRSFVSPVLV